MVQSYYIRQGLPNQNSHKICLTTGSVHQRNTHRSQCKTRGQADNGKTNTCMQMVRS